MEKPPDFAAAINEALVKLFGSVVTFATAACGVIDFSAINPHSKVSIYCKKPRYLS